MPFILIVAGPNGAGKNDLGQPEITDLNRSPAGARLFRGPNLA